MAFRRTDQGKITWPRGISSEDRRFCREIYNSLTQHDLKRMPEFYNSVNIEQKNQVIIGCSGGLDSTVLAHAYVQKCIISPKIKNEYINTTLVYIDHNLRSSDEINKDIQHVKDLASKLGVLSSIIQVGVKEGNIQAQAREARYNALNQIAHTLNSTSIYIAHHANDVAETKLWQFLTGRPAIGIERAIVRDSVVFSRPLIDFTREDLVRYASIWSLNWQEDATNSTNKYTRNRIRHELIPWIEKEVNPGLVKMLGKLYDKLSA
jgi:tRNA(Ile)-lysidine synthase